jgi:ParB-like chromosome segregation protein Spo0J
VPARRKGQAVIEKLNARLEQLQIEYVSAATITPNDYNPNRQSDHEFALLKSSILEDGFTDPVKVVDREGVIVIVDGEHRWRAVTELAAEGKLADDQLAIVKLPMGEAQAKIATLRHNRARGSEDIELAVDVLRDLERLGALDWAADSLELSDAELNRLLEDIPAPESLASDEFGEAWQPAGGATDQPGARGEIAPGTYADSTDAGATAARDRQDRLNAARDDQERAAIARDRTVYRLSLTFAGEEADMVKSALGDRPAARILEWCRDAAGAPVPE